MTKRMSLAQARRREEKRRDAVIKSGKKLRAAIDAELERTGDPDIGPDAMMAYLTLVLDYRSWVPIDQWQPE